MVKLFLQWIKDYSELHFAIVGAIYNSAGITRGGVWDELGRKPVREDSSDADLFRLFSGIQHGRLGAAAPPNRLAEEFSGEADAEGSAFTERHTANHEVGIR
ncbi:hypothetical protein H8B02_37870 [Bradyrhizobium sp. Pear77]|uniref:hypothetical protein n=1 Tax=Bradyrhizobium TaxID=374 RepID=UPI001E4DB847|nr:MULTISPECIES: hypothetical protein [Bradyrhizobium]MCC8958982.1 hypothetical protein [Bradyrhizobium altum]MCC8967562.1 hypothetical protein [Bradyrhizobium oropedii]